MNNPTKYRILLERAGDPRVSVEPHRLWKGISKRKNLQLANEMSGKSWPGGQYPWRALWWGYMLLHSETWPPKLSQSSHDGIKGNIFPWMILLLSVSTPGSWCNSSLCCLISIRIHSVQLLGASAFIAFWGNDEKLIFLYLLLRKTEPAARSTFISSGRK